MAWSKIKESPNFGLYLALIFFGLPIALTILYFLFSQNSNNNYTKIENLQLWKEPLKTTQYDAEGFAQLIQKVPDFSGANWKQINLPNTIPLPASVDITPSAPMARAWFNFKFTLPSKVGLTPDFAIYGTRIMGGAYAVYIDNELVHANIKHWRIQWNYPLYVNIPIAKIKPNATLDIKIAVPYRIGQGYAVGSVYAGTGESLTVKKDIRNAFQTKFTQFSSLFMVIMGFMAFHFWLYCKSETSYLILVFASIAFAITNTQYFFEISNNEALSAWYSSLIDSSAAWLIMLTYFYATRIEKITYPLFDKFILIFTIGLTVLTFPIWEWQKYALLLQTYFEAGMGVVVAFLFGYIAYKGASLEFKLIMVSEWLMVIFGVHTIVNLTAQVQPDLFHTFPYASFIMFLSFIFTSQRQHIRALNEVEYSNNTLASKLAQRELEIRHQHSKLLEAEKSQTLLLERQRLVRDMHDGIGSSLMTTLAIAKQGQASPEKIAEVLRDCLDDLKNVIESLEPIEHDIATLLGMLRQRLGNRLQDAGLNLIWIIEDLPPLKWLEPPQALQISRIVQEIISNVLKHAQAKEITFHASVTNTPGGVDAIKVSISDDGIGFDENLKYSGRGQKNLQSRAHEIGAKVMTHTAIGKGTTLELYLPINLSN